MRLSFLLIVCGALVCGCAAAPRSSQMPSLDARFKVGDQPFADNFQHGTTQWVAELEKGGSIETNNGILNIDVPGGCTLWFKEPLESPVMIEYDVTVIQAGGPNDRVSDLNCFWMANDPRSPEGLLNIRRSGAFADYNQLKCYYASIGGNTNTTTRFRRYIGSPTTRPILPEHDLGRPDDLLKPNVKQHLQLVASDSLIQFYRDGKKVFEYNDPDPYVRGYFALRTVTNHMHVENYRVLRLHKS